MNYAVTIFANNVQITPPPTHKREIDDLVNLVAFDCPNCGKKLITTFNQITIEYELEDKQFVTDIETCKKCGQKIEIKFHKVIAVVE